MSISRTSDPTARTIRLEADLHLSATTLEALRSLLFEQDDGGGGKNDSATEPDGAAMAQREIGDEPERYCIDSAPSLQIKSKRNPRWTTAEDKLLLAGLSFAEVNARTGRTRRAVVNRKRTLLVPGVAQDRRRAGQALMGEYQAATTPAPASCRRWTLEEDLLLNDSRLTDAAIALHLGRSYHAVISRRCHLRSKQMGGAR